MTKNNFFGVLLHAAGVGPSCNWYSTVKVKWCHGSFFAIDTTNDRAKLQNDGTHQSISRTACCWRGLESGSGGEKSTRNDDQLTTSELMLYYM